MIGFRGKVVLASFALLSVAGGILPHDSALAAPVKQESREASFVPPTSEEAPLSLIYQSISTPSAAASEQEVSTPAPEEKAAADKAGDKPAPVAAAAPMPAGSNAASTSAAKLTSVPESASAPSAPTTPAKPTSSGTPASAEISASVPAPSAQPAESASPSKQTASVPGPAPSGARDAAQKSPPNDEALKIEQRIDKHEASSPLAKDGKSVEPSRASTPSAASAAAAPAETSQTSPAPAQASPAPTQASAAQTVASSPLAPVNPNAFGLLLADEGGFGAEMWKGTAYAIVERLTPSLSLPTTSPTLNKLAYRLLTTSAVPPEGDSMNILPGPNLSSMRIAKLVELGRPVEAWRLATVAREGQLDDDVLRSTAEAVLASGDATSIAEVCARAPDILKNKPNPDWQKILVVCNLRANDMKSAQMGLDVMTAQNVKDDIFFFLATKNALGGSKQLPRQLTPLKPLSLALLRFANLPLRNELYARPFPAMIPEILRAKTDNLNARLALAERAAAQGLIDAEFLGQIYADVDFSNIPIAARETNANKVRESGPILRARLYQIAMEDKSSDNRLFAALRLIQSVSPAEQGGTMRNLALAMLGDLTPQKSSSLMTASPAAALMISLLADDKPDHTMGWLKVTREAASQTPSAAKALKSLWPLIVLNGVESDKDFASNLRGWLKHILKTTDSARPAVSASTSVTAALVQEDAALRARREVAGIILLTLDAVGFSIPDDAWAQVVDAQDAFDKAQFPSALLLDRLRDSGRAKRKGETVLEALAATGGVAPPGSATTAIPLAVRIDIIRALRQAGFVQEAAAFAKETLLAMRAVSAGGSNGDDSR